ISLNLNKIASKTNNIEEINMTDDSSVGDTLTITASDVLAVTDSDNELFIKGDANDTVELTGLNKAAVSDHAGYDMYTGANDVTLYVDTTIDHIII
nr:hypothetical protein [Alcaligenaceae bacterium]